MRSLLPLAFLVAAQLTSFASPNLVPKPLSEAYIADAAAINIQGATVTADSDLANAANYLRGQLGQGGQTKIHLVKVTSPVGNFETDSEGYVIESTPGGDITISARTDAGAFYGAITLLQLGELKNGQRFVIPGRIQDKPRFAWRGLMIDDGRHFIGKAEVLRMLDLLALHKMNVFHWHLTEDQGWRVEIKKWPKLTEVGSKRTASPVMGDRNKSDDKPYGGFYTQEDLKEVVAKATSLHITVVPEIEMPGHAGAAIASYPQLGNSDIPKYDPKVATSWGVKYYTYAPKEETFAFIDDVFAELIPIFPSTYFHIGGDEAPKNQWKNSPFAQSVMKREKLKDEHELQSYFVGRVEKILNARGKKLIGWDEIQEGGLSKSATMMVWRDWKWAQLAADHGNQIVMSPTSHTYFDHSPGTRPNDPRFDVIGGVLPIEKVYAFEPIPAKFTPEQQKLVLGCQGQLWSEYIYNGAKLEYMAFPRVCALAEVAWSDNTKKDRNWQEFEPRLQAHLKRLDALKVNYHRNDGTPAVTDKLGRGE